MPNLTAALTALTSHYQANPQLPAWYGIYTDLNGGLVVSLLNSTNAARDLTTWADTIDSPLVSVLAAQDYEQTGGTYVHVNGTIADGLRIEVTGNAPGLISFLGITELKRFVPATVDMLRYFAGQQIAQAA